jgi:nucleoside-diphosphate-sugar epimerase/predicted dehydrogenase
MKILILASSSFAATGLAEGLTEAGHEVWTFNRSPLAKAGARDLSGSYDQLAALATQAMANCDVLINYAIVKNGSIEENIAMADSVMAAARQLSVRRFIHISSISVLPSVSGTVNEDAVAVEARWKGIYSRVKAAVETHIVEQWSHAELNIVRPGFILAQGLVDSMVGTGMKLPTGHVLGLGNRGTVIMLVHRDAVNAALTRMSNAPLSGGFSRKTYMLVAPNAPTRGEYLDFHCKEMGRGWSTLHVPVWLWRVGLALGSPLLSLLKRKTFRLVKLFEHNLNVRHYDCSRTTAELELDMSFDWQQSLRDLVHVQVSPVWPGQQQVDWPQARKLGYVGMGRIVGQKHLPGLQRLGFGGTISWSDPAVKEAPPVAGLNLANATGLDPEATHVVVTAPWIVRAKVLDALPNSTTHVLFEKPLAVSKSQLADMQTHLGTRKAAVLHNYRFKPNVLRYRDFLRRHPSGALRGASLHYETPSPANEQSAWMKQEKRHRILLCDYSMHYLDLTWMFCDGAMQIHRCGVNFNDRDELETLSAAMSFNGVPCDVLIRSGCHQRQCVITHHFQNYSAELRFFPDVFVPIVGGKGMADDLKLGGAGLLSTGGKVLEKLGVRVGDRSHDVVLSAFAGMGDSAVMNELSVSSLLPFYERLTTLADLVYE